MLQRIRRFLLPGPGPDHPLAEEERTPEPGTAVDEVSSTVEDIVGVPFDPGPDDGLTS